MPTVNLLREMVKRYFAYLVAITLVACGGGGSGGVSFPTITYTGATTQASVSDTNAADIAINLLEGSSNANSINPYNGAVIVENNTAKIDRMALMTILANQVKDSILENYQQPGNLATGVTLNYNGTCSGHPGSYSIDDNSSGGTLSGSFNFNNFCISLLGFEIEKNGTMSYTGSYTMVNNTVAFNTMNLKVNYLKLTVRVGGSSVSEEFSGDFVLTFDGTTANNLTNLSMTSVSFKSSNKVYKITNLNITAGTTLTLSGTFYHPDYGYVVASTTDVFERYTTDPDQYCGGSLQLTGSNGVIDFTADTSCTTYDVCVTPNGGTPTCNYAQTWP